VTGKRKKVAPRVISFKVHFEEGERIDEAVTKLSEGETPWRKAMSPHQAARAIVLAVSGEPGFEPVLEKLGLRKVNEQ